MKAFHPPHLHAPHFGGRAGHHPIPKPRAQDVGVAAVVAFLVALLLLSVAAAISNPAYLIAPTYPGFP